MKSLDQYASDYFKTNLGVLHSFYPGLRVEVLKRELEVYLFGVESHNGKRLKEFPFLQGHHQKAMYFFNSMDKGIPLPYITGKAFFYKNDFFVNPNVLIPRSETEILVEDAVGFLKKMRNEKESLDKELKILEVGTGSGALILSLLSDLDFSVDALATDISDKALEIAKKNYFHCQYGIHARTKLSFLEADRLFFNEKEHLTFDLIVSNPPYIKRKEDFGLVHKKVHEYEPHEALYLKDEEYLAWFDVFFNQVKKALNPGGVFIMEGHENHLGSLQTLFLTKNVQKVDLKKDYCDRIRFLIVKV
ncbi:MAG: HemK/PrmC family methyltransferase [Bdellovibrionota bacterium]|nr:HemK/PrmC family methyltransferase [Bdellovibrionota bacterium]